MTPLLLSLSQSHSLEKHWSIIYLVSIKLLKSQLPVIKVTATGAATGNCFGSFLVVSGYKFINPTIFNILRWVAGLLGQMTHRPSV